MQDRPTCSLLSKRGDVGRRRMLSARRERGQENGTGARSPACRDGDRASSGCSSRNLGSVSEVSGRLRVGACASPCVRARSRPRVCMRAASSCVRVPCVRACPRACVHIRVPGRACARAFPGVPASQGCWRKAWDGLSAPPSVQPNVFCIGHQKVL